MSDGRSKAGATLQILFRGPLESCNYGCGYCPFAKRHERPDTLRADRDALARFVDWASQTAPSDAGVNRLEILFTPWGEALHRRRYQQAIATLAAGPHIGFVGTQTNLSTDPRWLADVDASHRAKVGLWATWHPSETSLDAFAERVRSAIGLGVTVSAGIVATHDHLPLVAPFAAAMTSIDAGVTLWVNAYKSGYRTPAGYYDSAEIAALTAIDPWFVHDLAGERSGGRPCGTGTTAIAVAGDGTVTRCHFVARPAFGNLYTDPVGSILSPTERPCSRAECNCFQGYVHLVDAPGALAFPGSAKLSRRPRSGFDEWPIEDGSSNPAIHAAAWWQR